MGGSAQSASVAAAAGGVNVALIAVACIVMSWPDADFAESFLVGMSAIGQLESSGIFRDRHQEACMSMEQFLSNATEATDELEKDKRKEDSWQFLRDAVMSDRAKGVADVPISREAMNKRWVVGGAQSRCLILREQVASGRQYQMPSEEVITRHQVH